MAATVPGGMRRRQSSTGFSRSGNGQSAAFWWTGCGGLALRSMFVLFLGVGPGGRGVPMRGGARGAAGVHAGMRMPGFTRGCRGSGAAEAVQEEGGGCPCPCPSPSVPAVAPCRRPLFLPSPSVPAVATCRACRPSGRLGARGVAARCAPGRALRLSGVFSGPVPGWSRACPPAWRPAWSRAVRNGPGVWRTWGTGGSGGPAEPPGPGGPGGPGVAPPCRAADGAVVRRTRAAPLAPVRVRQVCGGYRQMCRRTRKASSANMSHV